MLVYIIIRGGYTNKGSQISRSCELRTCFNTWDCFRHLQHFSSAPPWFQKHQNIVLKFVFLRLCHLEYILFYILNYIIWN